MKTFMLACWALLLLTLAGFAQKPITIVTKDITFKHGVKPGFVVTIPEVTYKTIENAWTKLQEKGTKSGVQNDAGELWIFGANITDIAPGEMNVYSNIKDCDTAIVLTASFELKPKDFVAPGTRNEEVTKTRTFLLDFAKEYYLELAEQQLQDEQKKLGKLEDDLKSLENDKLKIEKMIQTNTLDIASTNDELVVTRTSVLSLNEELKTQTNEYNSLADGAAKDEKKKYIDDLEKKIKKTNKSIDSGEKKIVDLKDEIDKAQKDGLPNNLKDQDQKKKDIEKQKFVVGTASAKVEGIKSFK
jgi:hypothetical protein